MSIATTAPPTTVGCIDNRRGRDALAKAIPPVFVAPAMREFDDFYAEHRDAIGRALVFVLGDQSLAEDAVDEAMAKAFQKWDEVGAMESPDGWVFVVGKRWGLSWRRGRRRERKREELVVESRRGGSLESTAEHLDLIDALQHLTPDQRSIVVCRFSFGLSVDETAELLGIKPGTAKSRLSRSVARLRELMMEDDQ